MGYGVAMRTNGYTHLSVDERETLSLGLAQGYSVRTMATVLRRAPSTVSREQARNVARGHPYRACTAQRLAVARARRPRRARKLLDPWLWQYDLALVLWTPHTIRWEVSHEWNSTSVYARV